MVLLHKHSGRAESNHPALLNRGRLWSGQSNRDLFSLLSPKMGANQSSVSLSHLAHADCVLLPCRAPAPREEADPQPQEEHLPLAAGGRLPLLPAHGAQGGEHHTQLPGREYSHPTRYNIQTYSMYWAARRRVSSSTTWWDPLYPSSTLCFNMQQLLGRQLISCGCLY